MKRIRNIYKSIRFKSTLSLIVPFTLIVVFVLFYFPKKIKDLNYSSLENELRSEIGNFAFALGIGLHEGNYEYIDLTYGKLKANKNLKYLSIRDELGDEIISYGKLPYDANEFNKDNVEFILREKYVYLSYQIQYKDLALGKIFVVYSLERQIEAINRSTQTSVMAILLFLLGGVAFLLFFVNRMTKSIVKLKNSAKEASTGNYDVFLKKDSDDEVGDLTDSFNSMIQSVKESRVALENEKNSVERRAVEQGYKNLKTLFDSAPFGMLIADFETNKIIEINKALLKILDKEEHEIIGKIFSTGLSSKSLEYAYALFVKNQSVENLEVVHQTSEGEERTILVSTQIINYEERLAILSVFNDITERKVAEKKLYQANKYIEYIINSIPYVIITIDEKMNVLHSNEFARKYVDNLKAQGTLFEVFSYFGFIKDVIISSISNNKTVTELKTITDDEGLMRSFSVSVYPMLSEIQPGSVVIIEDQTEKLNVQQLMIQSEKMLSVAGLAAGMAHEINNPLGTVSQGCQNLERRLSLSLPKNLEVANLIGLDLKILDKYMKDREIYAIIESIRNAAGKAAGIIKNMLQFSRKGDSKKVNSNLYRIIDNSLELAYNDYNLKKRYDFRSIDIIKDIDPAIPEIWANEVELQQVMFNLLMNAAQAFKNNQNPIKKPTIELHARSIDNNVIIKISDNGPGMPDVVQKRIFEPFFTTKEVGEGTGLGLSVVYMIITKNHGGKISVDSKTGVGTTFTIQIPIVQI